MHYASNVSHLSAARIRRLSVAPASRSSQIMSRNGRIGVAYPALYCRVTGALLSRSRRVPTAVLWGTIVEPPRFCQVRRND